MFSMIPCAVDCIYQIDGYCTLDTPAIVTNTSNQGCVHRIQLQNKTHVSIKSGQKPVERINQWPPQKPLSHVSHL